MFYPFSQFYKIYISLLSLQQLATTDKNSPESISEGGGIRQKEPLPALVLTGLPGTSECRAGCQAPPGRYRVAQFNRHRLNEYLAQRVPSLFLARGFRMCLN